MSYPAPPAQAQVISLRHRFFHDRKLADNGLQAEEVGIMVSAHGLGISFAFDIPGNGIGH
jgi:hypothetical protein